MHRVFPVLAMLAASGSLGPGGDAVRIEPRDAVKRERSSGPPAWRTSGAHMSAGELAVMSRKNARRAQRGRGKRGRA